MAGAADLLAANSMQGEVENTTAAQLEQVLTDNHNGEVSPALRDNLMPLETQGNITQCSCRRHCTQIQT